MSTASLIPCVLPALAAGWLAGQEVQAGEGAEGGQTNAGEAYPPALQVIESTEFVLPREGRSIIIEKVVPPEGAGNAPVPAAVQPAGQIPPDSPAGSPNAAGPAVNMIEHHLLMLSCTVFDGTATLVRWDHDGAEYLAWSTINFHHFSGTSSLMSADGQANYSLMMGVDDAETTDARTAVPEEESDVLIVPPLPTDGPGFILVQGDATNADALAGMLALHELYRTDGSRLKAEWEASEVRRAEQEAWLQANPPHPVDTIIQFGPGQNAGQQGQAQSGGKP